MSERQRNADQETNVETWRTLQSVCIVEPSRMQALMLRDALKKSGVSSIEVHDRGTKVMSEQSPPADVVVTSMHVPDMSGIELIKKLRDDHRFDESMLILNSSDSTIDELIEAGRTGPLALVSKKTKPDELLRAVHACTFLDVPAASFDTTIDPLRLRVLIVSDSGQIPERIVELIRTLGLLDVETATPPNRSAADGPKGHFHLAILLRAAGDTAADAKLYTGLLKSVSEFPTAHVTATTAVQIDGDRVTLCAVSSGGFTAITHCPLDETRLNRLLQITA